MIIEKTFATLDRQVYFLRDILSQSALIKNALEISTALALPDWYIGAGAIAQTYWNYAHQFPLDHGIKDIDLVYFDTDLSEKTEQFVKEKVQNSFAPLGIPVDVKNQARVHLWYGDRFGKAINAYISCEEAISQWPTTATGIGVSYVENEFKVFAPYGLSDLFSLTVRANKSKITTERWKALWKNLQILEW